MKLATKILSLFVLVGLATFYVGCGPDDPGKTEQEKQLEQLNSSWSLTSANDGSSDRTSGFPNLVLTLAGTYAKDGTYNYSFSGTRPNPSPWPVSGTWKFGTNVTSDLIRDPGTTNEIPMTYTVSGTSLTVNFTIASGSTGWPGGTSRIGSVTGNWSFVFTKQ
jgi:hypothetical protein